MWLSKCFIQISVRHSLGGRRPHQGITRPHQGTMHLLGAITPLHL